MFFFRPRAAIVAGIAFSLAMYLSLYGYWVSTIDDRSGLIWLGYLFSFPGAVLGAVLAAIALPSRPSLGTLALAILAAAFVAIGIALNQAVICNTVMYCGGK
jgi:hypothetical protein